MEARMSQYYPQRGVVGRHDETFNDVLYQQLRRTPWYVISLALHGVLLVVLWNMSFISKNEQDDVIVQASQSVPEAEALEEPPPEVEEVEEIEEEPIEDPTIKDAPVSDRR